MAHPVPLFKRVLCICIAFFAMLSALTLFIRTPQQFAAHLTGIPSIFVNEAVAADLTQPESYDAFVSQAKQRAALLAALEFSRALDAVTAVHGPQDLSAFSARQATDRLRNGGWTDPMLPFDFDATPLALGKDQRFLPVEEPTLAPYPEHIPPVRLQSDIWKRGLVDARFFVRWYTLACLSEFPERGAYAHDALTALIREPMPALTRAYAEALKPLTVYPHLASAATIPGMEITIAGLSVSTSPLDSRCLGLLLSTAMGIPFPDPDAGLVLAQLARGYPVQSLELEIRQLPPIVLAELADGLRSAWAQPQDRLISLLARFPESGPCLEALAHALLNRNHANYAASHRTLVHTWEQLTGIAFKGNAEPYLQWYHAHKPMPALP